MNIHHVILRYRKDLHRAVLDAAPALDQALTIQGWANDYTGYGHFAYESAMRLDGLGYQVAFQPIGQVENATQAIKRCMSRCNLGPVLVAQPVSYPFREADFWFTMHETTAMPQEQVQALNRVGAVIVPSTWGASCFQAQGVTRPIYVCPIGVDLDVFHPEPVEPEMCVFGAAGNTSLSVAYRKNIDLAVLAFSRAFPTEQDVELRLKLLPSCTPPATQDPRIKIAQAVVTHAELAAWMVGLTAFVLPSRGEGFGLLALQAMACGKPVLAANFGGVTDFFNDCNGYPIEFDLVPPKDCYHGLGLWAEPRLDSLVDQMRRVYKDRLSACAKGRLAAKTAERFSWSNCLLKLEDVLFRTKHVRPEQPVPPPPPPQPVIPPVIEVGEPTRMRSNDLTVAITNFHRPQHLKRAIESCITAGVNNIVVASMEPDSEVMAIIQAYKDRVKFTHITNDLGCNELWLQAAYRSTKYVLILHDDDFLAPRFGEVYDSTIEPYLDKGGMVTWRGCVAWDDGTLRQIDYWHGPTQEYPADEIARFVATEGRLSLSPIITVFRRETLIHALKEAEQYLTHQHSWLRPGMLLGTEIIAHLRHSQEHQRWLYIHENLSFYGAHPGSGTVQAEQAKKLDPLVRGYDLARRHFQKHRDTALPLEPRILLVYNPYELRDDNERRRVEAARFSWQHQFNQGKILEFPVMAADVRRTSARIGDDRPVLVFNDVIDWAMKWACPEDIVMYINLDVGMTVPAADRIKAGVIRGKGATVAPRRDRYMAPGKLFESVKNCKPDGGFDAMCVTPAWWRKHWMLMPEMYLGREAYDTVFRTILEELYTGTTSFNDATGKHDFTERPYFTDDVLYHECHIGYWQQTKMTNPGQIHNRKAAARFFRQGRSPWIVAATSDSDRLKICVCSLCHNQQDILPFYLRHYAGFADKIIVWDDASTDDSVKLLQACNKVDLRSWPFASGMDEDLFLEHAYLEYPKLAKDYDWVIWVDMDELIYHPDLLGVLKEELFAGTEVIRTVGYNMVGEGMPADDGRQIYEQLQMGVHSETYSKPVVFRPYARVRWGYGKHRIADDNTARLSKAPRVKLLHYRYMGVEYTRIKNAKNFARVSAVTLAKGLANSCAPDFQGLHSPLWVEQSRQDAVNAITAEL